VTEHWREVAAGADRVKTTFLAHIGDALESPLHAVLGNLELIDGAALADDDRARLQTVRASAAQLRSVIDGLLQLAASEARPFAMVTGESSTLDFLDAIEGAWQRRLAGRGQLLVTEADGDVNPVRADWARLRRIADLLLENVFQHADPGLVRTRLGLADRILTLSVADSGPGIDDVQRDQLLIPFRSIPQDAGTPHTGAGIGLAVALRLAEAVGGALELRRAGNGTGAIVVIPTERRGALRASDTPTSSSIGDT
jgi:signal transduction histidine kinase